MAKESFLEYDEIIKLHPAIKGIVDPNSWNYIGLSNKQTRGALDDLWRANTRKNINRKMWKRHGSLRNGCMGIGKNKALIAVGAGQSFNKNKDFLKKLIDFDGRKNWEDRDFFVVASNHQFKPLVKMGIIPDFVILADASDDVIPQFIEDIPPVTECGTILITTIASSPKLVKLWTRQGRDIRFYVPSSTAVVDEFEKVTGKSAEKYTTLVGGNVLNCLFLIGITAFDSSSFIALGNDLSYIIEKDIKKRRKSYYADGDYDTTQMQKGRDEAKNMYKWQGFEIERQIVYIGNSNYRYNLSPVGTTHNLWVYKTWIEAWMLANMDRPDIKWHYYNCSEGGILGVMSKNHNNEPKKDTDWYLLDEVCPRYHTMMLEDAAKLFITAKEMMRCQMPLDAPLVNASGQPNLMDIAKTMQNNEGIFSI